MNSLSSLANYFNSFLIKLKNKYQSIDTIYTGMIDDVCKYLSRNKIDLVIVPSISPFETFSLSMVESWSMGIPTIATTIRQLYRNQNETLNSQGNSYLMRHSLPIH